MGKRIWHRVARLSVMVCLGTLGSACSSSSSPDPGPDPGMAIQLLGDGGNVEFDGALIGDRTTYTIEFWIKPKWPPTQAPVHPHRNAIYAESYDQGGTWNGAVRNFLQIVNEASPDHPLYEMGSITIEPWPASHNVGTFTPPLPEDEWCHVAFVADGTDLRVYVDGVLQDESALQLYLGPEPVHFHIGYRPNPVAGDNYGWATLDDLRVSSTARYGADFVPPRIHEVDADTLSLWRFDETGGPATADAAGRHADGVVSPTVQRVLADR